MFNDRRIPDQCDIRMAEEDQAYEQSMRNDRWFEFKRTLEDGHALSEYTVCMECDELGCQHYIGFDNGYGGQDFACIHKKCKLKRR